MSHDVIRETADAILWKIRCGDSARTLDQIDADLETLRQARAQQLRDRESGNETGWPPDIYEAGIHALELARKSF
jgi:hypothetical protein